jgi:hypothetical protein
MSKDNSGKQVQSLVKNLMKPYFQKLDDEDVIHILVELRRMKKRNDLGRYAALYKELDDHKMI